MKIQLEVRDYECDVQGIVNNANYLNYLEHARHKFLLAHSIDFVALSKEGRDLVVREMNLVYHKPLKPDDIFEVETKIKVDGKVKLVFEQEIFRAKEHILSAKVTGVCVDFNTNKIFKISDILPLDQLKN